MFILPYFHIKKGKKVWGTKYRPLIYLKEFTERDEGYLTLYPPSVQVPFITHPGDKTLSL
jgi:hypothetical protein